MSQTRLPQLSIEAGLAELALGVGRVGAWSHDLRSGKQAWNDVQYEILGLPRHVEPTRDLFLSLVEPEDLPLVEIGQDSLRPDIHYDCEFRIRKPDGAIRWLVSHSMTLYDADGSPTSIVGVNWDITEHKEMSRAREQAERRLELATRAAEIGIWEWNVATGEFYYSPRARDIYGFGSDEVVTFERLRELTHPEDYKTIEPGLAAALDPVERSRRSYRYRIRRVDTGEERWLLAHGQAEFSSEGAAGRPLRYTGTLQDVTREMRLENELREEQTRLTLALGAADLAVWEVDVRNNRIVASEDLKRLYGFAPESDPSLQEFLDLYAPGEVDRVTRLSEEALARGEGAVRFEAKHLLADGSVKWIGVRAQVYSGDDGIVDRMIGVAMDVTDRVVMQERLQATAQELSHRVKNSLAIVQSLASRSFRTATSIEEAVDAFSGRLQSLATATDLITRGNWEAVPVQQIVEETIRPHLNDDGKNFRLELESAQVTSQDAVAVGMALHELCTNAVKYGALSVRTGRVAITSSVKDGVAQIEWRESGGPPVRAPARRGFGTQLLRQGIFGSSGGGVELAFEPEGVRARITVPTYSHVAG